MDLGQRIAQLSPTKLALLEQKLKKNKPPGPKSLAGEQLHKYAPLSFSQERLWFLEQMEPDSCVYNLPAIVPLRGPIDPHVVEGCLKQIVARHSALRTRFVVRDDNPYQLITDDVKDALDFLTIYLQESNSSTLSKTLNNEIWVPFNLATGPLVRARLILQRNNDNLLLVVMHHIISDGWSLNIFTREFRKLLESAFSSNVSRLPELPLQYVDYSISQRRLLEGDKLKSLLSYWRGRLEGAPSVLELPLDRPRPARQSFNGALYPFTVPQSVLQKLKPLCYECGVVPFMALLGAFKVLLFRYTHQSRIVVGTPIANRKHSDLEAVIGFFTNTLVLCSSVASDMTFRQLLAQIRENALGAYDHQELPFEKLVSELQPQRSLSHNPLFQVMFTFQNLPTEKSDINAPLPADNQPDDVLSLDFKISKFDLTLAVTEVDYGLSAVFEYATALFDTETIQRMATHFVNVLEHVLEHPDDELGGFCFLSNGERTLMLEQWNDTGREWPEILPLHGRFEKWARETPNSEAVIFQNATLTYGQLDQRANAVARLLQSRGIGTGSIVGICLRRSFEMVVGLLGILKAGAAYLAIEPDTPQERIAYMLGDANVAQLLTTSDCVPALMAHNVELTALDEIEFESAAEESLSPSLNLSPGDLAYVLYTSGSTGRPKGVMVSHGAIYNRLQWMQEEYQLKTDDRVMQKTPFTFDVSVWEFFWTLSEGSCLVVAEPERHKESAYLVDLIRKRGVTCLHFVPSMLQLFLHEDLTGCDSLKRIICSGEAFTIEQCRRLQALPGISGHNLYGPTEAAVDVTHWDCDQWRDQYLSVPIGRPIANTQIYILNDKLQPSPIGVSGELYIGGHNLARGYLNKPELTEKQFIANPFQAGTRLYKTGDLARFRSDGNIEYIGRTDSQIKLRGLRIELGEIEFLLRQHPDINEAVVVVNRFGDYDERLTAYVVIEDPESAVDLREVTAFLSKNLPSYMVPASIQAIPELPLTPNGKLDRSALPEPSISRVSERIGPMNYIEHELLAVWRKFLKVDSLGTNDDFFALGGHSILATQVINKINGQYHLNVPVRLLFENPTIKSLATALNEFEDEAWLDESMIATAMLMRSNRRVLQSLDDLSEEQLDDFLKQHIDEPLINRFDDTESLLAWSRNYLSSDQIKPGVNGNNGASSAALITDSLDSAFFKYYLELTETKAAIENIYRQSFGLDLAKNGRRELAAKLQEQGNQIFESYAREVKRHFSENGHGIIAPARLVDYCGQLISMAGLAASIKSF